MAHQEFEMVEVFGQAETLLKNRDIPDKLARQDVVHIVNNVFGLKDGEESALTYGKVRGLDNTDIVSPEAKASGRKKFYTYSKKDIVNIFAYMILRLRYGVDDRQAKASVGAWQFTSKNLSSTTINHSPITEEATITGGAARAQRYIWTRSLKYALALLFGDLPLDTYVVVEKLGTPYDTQVASSLKKVENNISEKDLVEETSLTRIVARIESRKEKNEENPWLPFIINSLRVRDPMHPNEPYIYELHDSATSISYRLRLYPPRDFHIHLTQEGEKLLTTLKSHQEEMISALLKLAFQRFKIHPQTMTMPALTEAALQIFPQQLDYCGVLLPIGRTHRLQKLGFYAYDANFPEELRAATISTGDFISGWVHENCVPIYIERLAQNDARVSELEKGFTAVAVAPLSTTDSWGVLYALRRRPIGENEKVFTPVATQLFSILAGIAGEISANERILTKNTQNVVRAISEGPVKANGGNELVGQLISEFEWVRNANPREYKDFNLSTIVFAIDNLDNITELCGQSVADWLEEQVLETSNELFGRDIKDEHHGQQNIFRFQHGHFALLIRRTRAPEDAIKEVAKALKEALSLITLTTPDKLVTVRFLSWGIVFSYDRYLRRKLGLSGNKRSTRQTPNDLAQTLHTWFFGAALASWHNDQAHNYLEQRNFDLAFKHFSYARAMSESPYWAKHQGQTLYLAGEFESALRYCEEALSTDPDYAGGHYMKAEVLTALGRIDEAVEEYQSAIEISNRAKLHWLFGISLAKHGRYEEAIEHFERAKELDPQNEVVYDLAIGRIQILQGKLVEARTTLRAISADGSALGILVQFETRLLDSTREKSKSYIENTV